MNIDFELYRIFYVVANNKNITKASQELNISQPAISKSIKNLEEQLGGTLFIRTKRGVILTEAGKEFYNYIRQAIEYINNAENKFTDLINLETGCIKIGISTTLTKEFLLPYLEEFHKLYPKIDIEIMTYLTSDLFPRLKNGLIDLIILTVLHALSLSLVNASLSSLSLTPFQLLSSHHQLLTVNNQQILCLFYLSFLILLLLC